MVLMAVVGTCSAAEEGFKWTWDTPAPRKKNQLVYPDAVPAWVEVGSQKTYIIFVDPASIRKTGNNATMVHLYELQVIGEVAGTPFRSVKGLAEYNCMNEQSRTLSATAYSGSMAEADPYTYPKSMTGAQTNIRADPLWDPNVKRGRAGVVNRISDPGKWNPITPGSTEEILWKYACGK